MEPAILSFSGNIASGKSTLSSAVAAELQWLRVSFGDYIRSIARSRKLLEERRILQKIGAELVKEDVEQLCRAVLAQANWRPGQPLIIDGVRHVEVLITLRRLVAPMKLYLIFIVVDEDIRTARLMERDEGHLIRSYFLESHSVEQQVKTCLGNMADLVINSAYSVETITRELISQLQLLDIKN